MRLRAAAVVSFALLAVLLCAGCSNDADNGNTDAAFQQELVDAATEAASESMPTGDMAPEFEREVEELDEEQTAAIERSIAEYTPTRGVSLFKNKAKKYYYREKVSRDVRVVYDAIVELCNTPKDTNRRITVYFDKSYATQDVWDIVDLAEEAVCCDHPELFWIYNGLEGWTGASVPHSDNGRYDRAYIYLSKPYANYEKEMKAFNKAVDTFMKTIDTKQSKANIALQIHDKICKWATYDMKVKNGNKADLGHTAYGVLVKDGYGKKHGAVCAGYAFAYLYLLQQVGIEATVITGFAGDDMKHGERHQWNAVKLGGDWYEVDITWNDQVDLKEWARDYLDRGGRYDVYEHMLWAASDSQYKRKLRHYLYNVTTMTIEHYNPGDDYNYYFSDGYWVYFLGSSIHVRDNDYKKGQKFASELMKKAPNAKGTRYAY